MKNPIETSISKTHFGPDGPKLILEIDIYKPNGSYKKEATFIMAEHNNLK